MRDAAEVEMVDGQPAAVSWRGPRYKVAGQAIPFSELLAAVTHLEVEGFRVEVVALEEPCWRYVLDLRLNSACWAIVGVSSATVATQRAAGRRDAIQRAQTSRGVRSVDRQRRVAPASSG